MQERRRRSREDAVIGYLEGMTERNGREYEGISGTRFRITMQPRNDWAKDELGFRVDQVG